VPAPHQLDLQLFELGAHPVGPCVPPQLELATAAAAADVPQPQEVEGLRLAEPAPSPVLRCKAAELDQARLLRMQCQRKLRQSSSHVVPEALRISLVLEADDDIVRVAYDDHVALGFPPPPLLGPQVEGVVEIDVGKQRRDHRALPRSHLPRHHDPVFQDPDLQPFLDQAQHPLVGDPMFQEPF